MRNLLVVKTGTTLPSLKARRGDYEDWIAEGLGTSVEVVDVAADEPLPDPSALRGVVITGSSALVTDRAPWSERTGGWLARVAGTETPMLGICYGHQLLADALGGEVGANPRGREIGTIEVSLTAEAADDPLFAGFDPTLVVGSSHRQSVHTLPRGAVRLAGNEHDPHQAYALGERVWGVQFHPEWDHDVVGTYLDERREILLGEGLDFDALRDAVRPSAHGVALLRRFAEIAGAR